jgi:polygalacturonase
MIEGQLRGMRMWCMTFMLARCVLCASARGATEVHAASTAVYAAPADEALSSRFLVTVDKENKPVYIAKSTVIAALALPGITRAGEAAFVSFDIKGVATLSVTVAGGVQSAKVLPSSSGITPIISGNRISFRISSPSQLTLEVNGDWMNSLHIFANPVEKDVPRADDPNVIYFGPGLHIVPPLQVGSGKTVYVAEGAFVYGKLGPTQTEGPVIWLNGSNITLRGRGVIDGSLFTKDNRAGNVVKVTGSKIRVEGVILRDSSNWNLPIVQSRQVEIDNVKILGSRENSDGIDIVNSQGVTISNGFIRTFDDLVVVKTLFQGAESSDITVKHMVLWNEIAHALSIGAEVRANVEGVHFFDCDIIHDKGREWLLRIFNTDAGTVSHVTFENIRIEESRRLMSLWVGKTKWSTDKEAGHIEDVTFRNIQSVSPEGAADAVDFAGADDQHEVRDVHVVNVTVGGRPLQASEIRQNGFASGVTVKP